MREEETLSGRLPPRPKMWCSPSESVQMEERARKDGEKGRRDDDEFVTTDNVDSGFLSAGNMQVSGEIRDLGTPQPRQEEDRQVNENRRAAPEATILASPSSSTIAVAEEPVRVIDSGIVDVDLSEGLNQLTLKKQSDLSPLAVDSEDLVWPEPTTILELTPVRAGPMPKRLQHRSDLPLEQDGVKKRATMNESTWQLYYAQDDDGDT